jgi:hypothetical protein
MPQREEPESEKSKNGGSPAGAARPESDCRLSVCGSTSTCALHRSHRSSCCQSKKKKISQVVASGGGTSYWAKSSPSRKFPIESLLISEESGAEKVYCSRTTRSCVTPFASQKNSLSLYIYTPNNKEAKFQAVFFVHPFFLVRLPLTTGQCGVSSVRTYI